METQRVEEDVKNDVFFLFDNLLHLLMECDAVGSVRVGKNRNFLGSDRVPHDQSLVQGNF